MAVICAEVPLGTYSLTYPSFSKKYCSHIVYSAILLCYIQTSLISIDSLMRVIHQSQLTEEFDGTLPYDNSEWIEIRMVGRNHRNSTPDNG